MSNPFVSLVNQRLAFARIQLQSASAAPLKNVVHGQLQAQSYFFSAIFHLIDVYMLFLKEIAHHYQIAPSITIDTADTLLSVLQSQQKVVTPAQEIYQLESDWNSWLAKLRQLQARRFELSPVVNNENLPLVIITDIVQEPLQESLSLEIIGQYILDMQFLIERQRETMIEY